MSVASADFWLHFGALWQAVGISAENIFKLQRYWQSTHFLSGSKLEIWSVSNNTLHMPPHFPSEPGLCIEKNWCVWGERGGGEHKHRSCVWAVTTRHKRFPVRHERSSPGSFHIMLWPHTHNVGYISSFHLLLLHSSEQTVRNLKTKSHCSGEFINIFQMPGFGERWSVCVQAACLPYCMCWAQSVFILQTVIFQKNILILQNFQITKNPIKSDWRSLWYLQNWFILVTHWQHFKSVSIIFWAT